MKKTPKPVSAITGAKRLLKLADALEAAVKAQKYAFNMCAFIGGPTREEIEKNDCGTAGCAIGYCPLVFPKHVRYDMNDEFGVVFADWPNQTVTAWTSPIDGAGHFFGINPEEANYLFSELRYMTRTPDVATVADRIREMANSKLPAPKPKKAKK